MTARQFMMSAAQHAEANHVNCGKIVPISSQQ
jgi:hypothetical protein